MRATMAFILIVVGLIAAASGMQPINEVIVWDSVPTTVPASRNLNSPNLGLCMCDLTANGCDPDCCCDSDCSTSVQGLFTSCLPEYLAASSVEKCFSTNAGTTLERINLHGGTSDRIAVGRDAVCVVQNNYPSGADAYFSVPSTVTKPTTSTFDWFVPPVSTAGFAIGDRMPMVRFTNISGVAKLQQVGAEGAYFGTWYGGAYGLCADHLQRSILFPTPITTSVCAASPQGNLPTSTVCDFFNLSRYTQLEAIANPTSSVTESSTLIVIQTIVIDADTGNTLYTIDDSPLRSSFFTVDSAINAAANSTTTPLSTQWNSATSTCVNAAVKVRTIFSVDATMNPRIRNVTREVFVSAGRVTFASTMTRQSIQFETFFLTQGSSSTIQAVSLPEGRGGNPGYGSGAPIGAGILLTNGNKQAVQKRAGGFAIPSGDESCFVNRYRNVGFMQQVLSSGCTIDITETELSNLCNNGTGTTPLLTRILSLPTSTASLTAGWNGTNAPLSVVARTGDAAITDVNGGWIGISGLPLSSPTPTPYNSVARSCSNLVVGIEYTFVVARAGAESNPQDVIVGAFADPILGTWRIRSSSDASGSASTTQRFKFQVNFERFEAYQQSTQSRRIVAPPILPEVDDTIFYPFRMP